MPEMDGYEFLERLHSLPAGADIPAIVLTSAILDAADRHRLRSASTILSKSELSASLLIDAIQEALQQASAAVGAG